jgi:hypothetical protein
MTHFGLSPDVVQPLCWALLHFLWQGLALALVYSALRSALRRADARYAVGVATLALMLAAPAATFLLLRSAAFGGPARRGAALTEKAMHVFRSSIPPAGGRLRGLNSGFGDRNGNPALPPGSELWLLEFWLAGVILLSARSLGGLWALERIRRREVNPLTAELEAMARALEGRLGVRRAIRYCRCHHLDAPAVIGWLHPVVLIPVSALTGLSTEQLGAVIAHELAHIRRYDALVNLFQTAVETLLFYHPAVWWVNAQIREEREHCCDDVAVAVCGGVPVYARALMLMEEWRGSPRLAMAANGSRLHLRVRRLMGIKARHDTRSVGFAAAWFCLALVLFAGTGLLGAARNLSDAAHALGARPAGEGISQAGGVSTVIGDNWPNAGGRMSLAAGNSPGAPSASPDPAAGRQESPSQTGKESFVGGLSAAGLKSLTADQLISLKVQGVTPEYVRQIHAAGLNPSVEQLIGMKVQGVTPDYLRGLQAHGLSPTVENLIGLKVQGVTPDYLAAMHAEGVDLTVDETIGMKVQGVTPEYIRGLRAEGLQPKPAELIGLRVQGVTPEYVQAIRAEGIKVDAEQLVALRVQGVTPEYVREMKSAGLIATADQVVGLRVQGVTPEFVRALDSAGLGKLGIDDFIEAKVMGITPEFAGEARSHGIQNLTLGKLIALKRARVF